MEQYEIPPSRYYQALCYALEHFKVEYIFIRLVGSEGGTTQVAENVLHKKLELKRCVGGLRIIIDGEERFLFRMTSAKKDSKLSGKCWSIAFLRIDEQGRMHHGYAGFPSPNKPPPLPEVKQTMFRTVNGHYLIEITFSGKIPIHCLGKLVSRIPNWYYWDIDRTL